MSTGEEIADAYRCVVEQLRSLPHTAVSASQALGMVRDAMAELPAEDVYSDCPFPHCDSRILHAPSECVHCDHYPGAQRARVNAGIAFTGHEPGPGQVPCPADEARPPGSQSDHRRWGGNKPSSAVGDPTWPAETFASAVFYGDQGGRERWPLRERITRRVKRPFQDFMKRRRGWRKENGFWRFP